MCNLYHTSGCVWSYSPLIQRGCSALGLAGLSGGIPGYWWRLTGAHTHALRCSLSLLLFLSPLHPTQHSAVFIQLTHEEILHEKKAASSKKKKKKRASKKEEHNQCSCNKTKRKFRNHCRSTQSKSPAFVFCLSFYLVRSCFRELASATKPLWRDLCAPLHISPITPIPSACLPPYPQSVCQTSFSHPVIVPNQQPLLWVCLFSVGLVCECHACCASLGRRREEEEKNSL